ncbi:hypothetical protein EBT31_07630 [bacterium]|nr:hypothetical protein [bacterium]
MGETLIVFNTSGRAITLYGETLRPGASLDVPVGRVVQRLLDAGSLSETLDRVPSAKTPDASPVSKDAVYRELVGVLSGRSVEDLLALCARMDPPMRPTTKNGAALASILARAVAFGSRTLPD